MIPILLGALAGFLATLLVLATAYRLLGWWREVPLDGEDFVLTAREWDQLQAPEAGEQRRLFLHPSAEHQRDPRLNGDT